MNKKIIAVFLVVSVMVIFGVTFFIVVKKSEKKQNETQKEKTIDVADGEMIKSDSSDIDISNAKDISEPPINEEKKTEEDGLVTEYINERYAYSMRFPGGWYMNNDYSESKIESVEDDDDNVVKTGGQTFWSNYKNMNDYSPDNKPNDFHMLALTVYEDESASIEDFAKKLEFDEDAGKEEFEVSNAKGVEFVAAGLVSGNPRVAVIFKKNNLFYVFNLAFIGGDNEVAGVMEGIVATLNLK